MLNKVTLIGRLGRDPELRYTPQGTPVASFSMACDTHYKNADGDNAKQTYWADVVVWGKRAEVASKYLSKGSLVYIEGRLQLRSWEKNGEKKSKTEVVLSDMKFIDTKRNGGGQEHEEDTTLPPEETTDLEAF